VPGYFLSGTICAPCYNTKSPEKYVCTCSNNNSLVDCEPIDTWGKYFPGTTT
jgi:hypothetical protein